MDLCCNHSGGALSGSLLHSTSAQQKSRATEVRSLWEKQIRPCVDHQSVQSSAVTRKFTMTIDVEKRKSQLN